MKRINKEKFWRIALPLALMVCTMLIWGQSLMPKTTSAVASQAVEQVLVTRPETEEKLTVQPKWWTKYFTLPNHPLGPSFFIRKGAHLVEFAALGVLWYACGRVYGRRWLWLLGLPTGIVDECLQLLSDRGALVADAVIDVAGYLIGCGLAVLIALLWRKKIK